MQFILVLICVTFMSTIESATLPKMAKPKLNLTSNKTDILEITRNPEERRKLSLFPKKNKKFVVELEEIPQKKVTLRPTKKPLMKKINFNNKLTINNAIDPIETTTESLTTPSSENVLKLSQSLNFKSKYKDMPEMVKEHSKENKEASIILLDEDVQTETYPINESVKTNTEINEDNVSKKQLFEEDNTKLFDNDEEMDDPEEFMFVNVEKIILNEPSITTAEPVKRDKRSDNIIEEENLRTTVSGYKFTWRDTRLTNDLVFKNIHS